MQFRALISSLRRWRKNESGGIAIMFGLAIIPMVIVAGMGIDYMSTMRIGASLQASVDGTALTVARLEGLPDNRRKNQGTAFFRANFPRSDDYASALTIEIRGTEVFVKARITVPTSMMRMAGLTHLSVQRTAEVPRLTMSKAEIALVADFSQSMEDNDKYRRMVDAATQLIEKLEEFSWSGNVKMGLVPFSGLVRVTLPNSHVIGQSGIGNWTGCTEDRHFPHNLNTHTPVVGNNATRWGELKGPESGESDPCEIYEDNNVNVVPLSTDLARIRNQLSAMRPVRFTHIALGAEFGWHLLSPNAPFTQGAPYSDVATRKSIILLTDGMQTSEGWGAGDIASVANAEENLVKICENIKAEGITVYTIGYDLDDDETLARLENCASPNKFYNATASEADITAVFESIGISIMESMLRLSK